MVNALIIGGGPAGATAGAWLAKQGRSVLICEKERFPRFHIGESLLPNGNRILKKTGVWKKIEAAGFVEKYGAEFTLPDRSRTVYNMFSEGLVKGLGKTYQVERSKFDKILLDHAQELGGQVQQRTIVLDAQRKGSSWQVQTKNLDTGKKQTVLAAWIVDASGRHCVMGKKLGIPKDTIPYPGRFAVFNHFTKVPRQKGKRGGNIIVLRQEDAWFWVIPISKTTTSIGVVAQKGSRSSSSETKEGFFWRKVRQSPYLSQALSQTDVIGEYRMESDYCFSYREYGTANTLLAGDAASFIDPVFSSGVYLALESGLLAAQTIDKQLYSRNGYTKKSIYAKYTKAMKGRIKTMRQLIDAYYDNSSFDVFMTPNSRLKLPAALNSILAGCTRPPFKVRWRLWLFQKICARHARQRLVAPIDWKQVTQSQSSQHQEAGARSRHPRKNTGR